MSASSSSRHLTAAAAVVVLVAAPAAVGVGAHVTIADSGTTTSRLAAELSAQALAVQGFTVARVGQPSAQAADAAVRSGTVDVYTTDTATLLERVLARPKERHDGRLPPLLAAALAGRAQTPLAITPYDDAPQVACTRAAVRAHRLSGVLSLGRAAGKLTYASSREHVVRADGLPALRVRFRRVIVSAGTGRFDAIARRRAHCVLSGGLEPRAARLSLVALRDRTRRLSGTPRHGVAVVSQAYLATAPAGFVPALDRVAALLTSGNARSLVGAIELDGQAPAGVAQAFLRANGVIP